MKTRKLSFEEMEETQGQSCWWATTVFVLAGGATIVECVATVGVGCLVGVVLAGDAYYNYLTECYPDQMG